MVKVKKKTMRNEEIWMQDEFWFRKKTTVDN